MSSIRKTKKLLKKDAFDYCKRFNLIPNFTCQKIIGNKIVNNKRIIVLGYKMNDGHSWGWLNYKYCYYKV